MAKFLVGLGKAALQGGPFSFTINTENVQVAEVLGDAAVRIAQELGSTAVKLGAIYAGYQLLKPVIDGAVKRGFGGPRDDEEVREIRPGSLHVLLRCSTDKRFLEVLADYESGRIKQRLQKELSQVGFEVEGLKIEIENMEEVNEIKAAINQKRYGNQYVMHKSFNFKYQFLKQEKCKTLRFICIWKLGNSTFHR